MTTLYLIRHAETVANIEERLCGMYETDLSDEGFNQIKKMSHHAKTLDIDVVYTSPLKRAYKTALALNWYIQKPLTVVHDLHEMTFGNIEGMLWKDIMADSKWDGNLIDRFHVYGGESAEQVYNRIVKTISKIISKSENKTIAIVSHGAVLRNYLCHTMGLKWDKFREVDRILNASVTKLIHDNKSQKYTIRFVNDTTYLGINN